MKATGIQWGWQIFAQINSVNLEKHYKEVKASRVGTEIWWTFQNHEKNRGCFL